MVGFVCYLEDVWLSIVTIPNIGILSVPLLRFEEQTEQFSYYNNHFATLKMDNMRETANFLPDSMCHGSIFLIKIGREYSTVDGLIKLKCYWTRALCDCGMLQNGDVTREVKFVSNDYSNPNTNPKILTTLALTLTDPHDAFESF